MINEEITQKECNLAVRVGDTAAAELKKALEKALAYLAEVKNQPTPEQPKQPKAPKNPDIKLKQGKQTLKQLHKHNEGLSSIELKDPNLRQLKIAMKKYDIDFSAVKDGKGKYILFFKGKNAEEMTRAISRYTQTMVDRADKKAIKATYELASVLNDITMMQKEKAKSEMKIALLDQKLTGNQPQVIE